jgi:signal transduction histidine kinase
MGPLRAIAHKNEVTLVLAHALLWLAGLGGIGLWTLGIRRRESERRQAEQAIRKYDRELAQANVRLQELDKLKSMFIASMSHELRTPLNSIIGFTGIILQGMSGEVTAEQRKQLTMVKTSAAHLLALINDVIDVSKIEAGKVELDIEQFDLAALVQEVKKSFETTADEQGLKITLEVPERLTVKSDERRTKQVIINFVSNAIKFTDEGMIDIKLAKRDDEAEVSVADTGIGIKKEDIGKLFQAFGRITTENRLAEGSGLGLYLSKKIADLLGGEIKAESEFARGSVFTFILPLKYQELKK